MFFIESQLNRLVMDLDGGSGAPGTAVIMYNKKHSDNTNQLFYEDPATGTIKSAHNHLCLEIRGNHLTVQPFAPGNFNQQWMFNGAIIANRMQPNRVLDIDGGNSAPGTKVIAWDYNGGQNQQWNKVHASGHGQAHFPSYPSAPSMPPAGPHCFWLKSKLNQLVLDSENGGTTPGTRLITWSQKPRGSADNQLFYIDAMTGTIRSKQCGLCVESTGRGVILNHYIPGNMNQLWSLSGDRVALQSNPNQVMDIMNADPSPGTGVATWAYNGGRNQQWSVEYE